MVISSVVIHVFPCSMAANEWSSIDGFTWGVFALSVANFNFFRKNSDIFVGLLIGESFSWLITSSLQCVIKQP